MKKSGRVCLIMVILLICVSLCNANIYAQDGVDNATEIASTIYNLKQGETLVLKEGNYQISGQAYLKENNITIKGAGKDKTFIHVKSVDASWGMTVTGSNCILQDFTLERSTTPNNAAAIKVMGGNNTIIKNIRTIGGYYGIDINPSIGTIVDGCEITNTSKGSIGVGSESSKQTMVTIQNTTTRQAGWKADVAINDKSTYGNSTVTLGKGNVFTNGKFYTENNLKSDFILSDEEFPNYKVITIGDVKVYEEIQGIKLVNTKGSLEIGDKKTISGIISPANKTQQITWSSLDTSIAIVNSNGEITGISNGEVTIRAQAGEVFADYKLRVFKVEVSVPEVDTSTPADKVDIGIGNQESKDIVNDTSSEIVEAVINNGTIDESVISSTTLNNIKNALLNGASISTKVETKSLEETSVDIEDKNQIAKSIKNLVIEGRTSAKVAQYLDIDIVLNSQKDDQSEVLGDIHQLDKAISFTVAVPEELKKDNRTFYVVRIHDGVATILQTTKKDDGSISFETNLFSTYALIYDDKVDSVLPEGPSVPAISDITKPTITEQVTPVSQKKESLEVLKTGDTSLSSQYLGWLMLSLLGMIKMIKK